VRVRSYSVKKAVSAETKKHTETESVGEN